MFACCRWGRASCWRACSGGVGYGSPGDQIQTMLSPVSYIRHKRRTLTRGRHSAAVSGSSNRISNLVAQTRSRHLRASRAVMTTKVSFTRGWPQRRIAAFFSMKSPRVSALAGGTSIELARGTWTVHTGLPADVLARSSRWHCYWRRWWQRPRRRAVATVSRLDTLCCVWAPRLPARLLCGPPSLCRRSIPKKFRTNGIFRIPTSSRCEWSV